MVGSFEPVTKWAIGSVAHCKSHPSIREFRVWSLRELTSRPESLRAQVGSTPLLRDSTMRDDAMWLRVLTTKTLQNCCQLAMFLLPACYRARRALLQSSMSHECNETAVFPRQNVMSFLSRFLPTATATEHGSCLIPHSFYSLVATSTEHCCRLIEAT